jgi:DNA-binding response OmpR family regulator
MMSKTKVLLVDDDPGFLKATALVLEAEGFEVFTAEDGAAGLAAAREHKPDAVVIDVMMRLPDEGFVLARTLRADPALAGAALLIVTGAGERYQMLFEPDDLWLPVDKVLEKPASGDDLVREIRTLLPRRQASGG